MQRELPGSPRNFRPPGAIPAGSADILFAPNQTRARLAAFEWACGAPATYRCGQEVRAPGGGLPYPSSPSPRRLDRLTYSPHTQPPVSSPFTVLLYYKYVPLSDPATLAQEQRALCEKLGLRGRILIGSEGINGTVAGTEVATRAYQDALRTYPEFSDVAFKISSAEQNPFPRLEIKVRREIVTLGAGETLDPNASGAPHLSPTEFKRMIEEDDVVLFDVRNRYESDVGRFKGAITPPIENFRELPQILPQYEALKDKTVLMYCTGGIRCEKASALFREVGFKRVFQLEGGIVTYGEQVGSAHWEGDCFVFDERMMVPVGDSAARPPFGRCAHTGVPTRNVINCLHDPCHRILLVAAEAIAQNPDFRLCPTCIQAGLTSETADYKGSPARVV